MKEEITELGIPMPPKDENGKYIPSSKDEYLKKWKSIGLLAFTDDDEIANRVAYGCECMSVDILNEEEWCKDQIDNFSVTIFPIIMRVMSELPDFTIDDMRSYLSTHNLATEMVTQFIHNFIEERK